MRESIFQITKSVLTALIISLAFVLAFTLLTQLVFIPIQAIKPVNQVFKTVAVAAGGLVFIRGEHGFLKGIIHGGVSVILTYLLFGIISSSLQISWLFILEIILGIVSGAISGILAVNIKKKQ